MFKTYLFLNFFKTHFVRYLKTRIYVETLNGKTKEKTK